jgi:RNA polymerase sigma-70 factor (ECF subfamily)
MESDEELRPYLFAIAYRMLGSVADAEDVVQDAFLRYEEAHVDADSPKAYLATVTTRLAIDELRSARARREVYPGEWLPEPVVEEDEARHAEMADSLSLTFLHLLEKLSPVERAVFLLREVFDYSYDDIAAIVGKSPANCRQILVRAHTHVDEGRKRFDVSREEREQVAERYIDAWENGDTEGLLAVLAPGATLYSDGGGKVPSIRVPLVGALRLAKAMTGWGPEAVAKRGFTYQRAIVNGEPALVFTDAGGQVGGVEVFEIADGLVVAIRAVFNPDKLTHLAWD